MTPGLAPCETDCPTPPRFRSQAFSTSQRFPGTPELRGLVSCHNRSWDPPFRAFPSQGSRTPLEAAGFLAVIHRRAVTRWTSPFAGRFPERPRSRAVAWFPDRLWTPFPRAEARFPVVPGLAQRTRSVPPASPTSKLCSPCETVPETLGCPAASGRDSRGFCPSKLSPPTPRILDPPRPQGPEHAPSSEDSGARHEGPRPLLSGETFQREYSGRPRRRIPAPLRDRPAPPLDGDSFSRGLGIQANLVSDLQSF
jgi:hypothetical protein